MVAKSLVDLGGPFVGNGVPILGLLDPETILAWRVWPIGT